MYCLCIAWTLLSKLTKSNPAFILSFIVFCITWKISPFDSVQSNPVLRLWSKVFQLWKLPKHHSFLWFLFSYQPQMSALLSYPCSSIGIWFLLVGKPCQGEIARSVPNSRHNEYSLCDELCTGLWGRKQKIQYTLTKTNETIWPEFLGTLGYLKHTFNSESLIFLVFSPRTVFSVAFIFPNW